MLQGAGSLGDVSGPEMLDWIMPHSAPCFFLSLPSNGAMEELAQTQDPHPFSSLGQSSPPSPDVKPFSDRNRPCQTAERRKRRAQQTLHLGSVMAFVSPAPLPAVLGWERKKGADNGNSAGKRTRNGQGLLGKMASSVDE
jgi:hypothetical protein